MDRLRTRALASCVALLAVLLAAPIASGAKRVERFEAKMELGNKSGGRISVEILFKNQSGKPKHFTPRTVTRVDFTNVPLRCANSPGDSMSELLLTRGEKTAFKFQPSGSPNAQEAMPGRYAFVFADAFSGFLGTISGKVDKPTKRKRGTPARIHGRFTIADLDAGPGFTNCSTETRSWSSPAPVE